MYILDSYDDALRNILKNGVRKQNRTGIDTLSIFGMQCRYRIDECFPLLTKRKVWPKAIFAELLWMISGSTNIYDLEFLGSKIWSPWKDESFEKKNGYIDGALGPVYGFQLRHFGGKYGNGSKHQGGYEYITTYGLGGFDQLQHMLDTLKGDPTSRRNLFSLWNPQDIAKSRLPPCHYTFQVMVENGKLSGMLTQRSCDFPIGVPANIQFYSALIYMLAQQTGYEPYEFIHSTADSHIYENQIPGVEEYLARPEMDSPKLKLNKANSLFEYKLDDFEVVNYSPLSSIKMPVAV